jgi:hypothetical protein
MVPRTQRNLTSELVRGRVYRDGSAFVGNQSLQNAPRPRPTLAT